MSFPQILVIDNEPSITEAFSIILANDGFDIQTARNNDEALTYIKKQSFDLILCDVHMEGLRFSDFIVGVRGMNLSVPIIAITGLPQFISDHDRSHIQGVLEKPFTQQILKEAVRLALIK